MTLRRAPKLATLLIGIAVLGAACGGSESGHNDADVTFTQQMIPHHTQAISMARLADTRASSSDVKVLAKRIEAAQDPEINKMRGWLENWGKSETAGHDMSHGDTAMTGGMMSAQDMAALAKANGPEFDRLFLTMMTQHHRGAVEMAKSELNNGKSKDAKALATSIRDSQTKEIAEMANLLAQQPKA